MGKNQKKKKTAVSLAEFNADHGVSSVDPDLAALPSAPRGEEAWAAEGIQAFGRNAGRREDGSDDRRGGPRDRDGGRYGDGIFGGRPPLDDDEFAERDWTRRGPPGPPSGQDGPGFGAGPGGDSEDWGAARRGPMAPVEGGEVDWSAARRGPLPPANSEVAPVKDEDWSNARRGPPPAGPEGRTANFGFSGVSDEAWSAARRGPLPPVERDPPDTELDWSSRRGPQPRAGPTSDPDADGWANARRGPPPQAEENDQQELDWGDARKAAPQEPPSASTGSAGVADEDWSSARGSMKSGPNVATNSSPQASAEDWTSVRGRAKVSAPRQMGGDDRTTISRRGGGADEARDWRSARRVPPTKGESAAEAVPKQAAPTQTTAS